MCEIPLYLAHRLGIGIRIGSLQDRYAIGRSLHAPRAITQRAGGIPPARSDVFQEI